MTFHLVNGLGRTLHAAMVKSLSASRVKGRVLGMLSFPLLAVAELQVPIPCGPNIMKLKTLDSPTTSQNLHTQLA